MRGKYVWGIIIMLLTFFLLYLIITQFAYDNSFTSLMDLNRNPQQYVNKNISIKGLVNFGDWTIHEEGTNYFIYIEEKCIGYGIRDFSKIYNVKGEFKQEGDNYKLKCK